MGMAFSETEMMEILGMASSRLTKMNNLVPEVQRRAQLLDRERIRSERAPEAFRPKAAPSVPDSVENHRVIPVKPLKKKKKTLKITQGFTLTVEHIRQIDACARRFAVTRSAALGRLLDIADRHRGT